MKRPTKIEAFEKIKKCIQSIETREHAESCVRMIDNFDRGTFGLGRELGKIYINVIQNRNLTFVSFPMTFEPKLYQS